MGMLKTQCEHVEKMVKNAVMCAKGRVATALKDQLKFAELTDEEMYQQIADGKAKLYAHSRLVRDKSTYQSRLSDALFRCYKFYLTDKQKEQKAHDKPLHNRAKALEEDIDNEARRINNNARLGLLEAKDVTTAIDKLVAIANNF